MALADFFLFHTISLSVNIKNVLDPVYFYHFSLSFFGRASRIMTTILVKMRYIQLRSRSEYFCLLIHSVVIKQINIVDYKSNDMVYISHQIGCRTNIFPWIKLAYLGWEKSFNCININSIFAFLKVILVSQILKDESKTWVIRLFRNLLFLFWKINSLATTLNVYPVSVIIWLDWNSNDAENTSINLVYKLQNWSGFCNPGDFDSAGK